MTALGGVRPMAACVLLAAALMPAVRPPRALAALCAVQGWALAVDMALQGLAQDRGALAALALTVSAGQGLLLPLGLRRLTRQPGPPDPGHKATAAAALALALLALEALPGQAPVAVALAVTLIGLLTLFARRAPPGQVAGLASLAAGCTLAATAMPGLPLPGLLLGPALLLLPAAGLALAMRA